MLNQQGRDEYVRLIILAEEEKSEKLANYWRIGMSLLFFAVSKGVSPEVPPFSQKVLWLGSTTYFLFSFYVFFHLRVGKYQPWLKYLSVFVDIFLISLVMWAFGTYRTFKTEAFLLYYVWIALATMRLSVRLTIFAGLFSLACYVSLLVIALSMGTIELGTISESFISPRVSMQNQALRIFYMSIVIFALTYGARAYRKLASKSYEQEMDVERQRMKAQKLESIGFLAGGIAHDFNNTLAIISNNIHIAKTLSADNPKSVTKLQAAESAVLKATNLTQHLLTFSKGGAPVMKTMPIDTIVKEAASLSLTGSAVRCRISEIPGDLRLVKVDEGQINQVLNNLLINALQASGPGSTVTINLANHDAPKDSNLPLSPGKYVRISVADQGEGIPGDHISKIFDPYFTTKERGSGLGLATAYSIIKQHSGHIEVKSTPGKGSVFHIYLPASDEKYIRDKPSEELKERKELNILIMDDEDEFLKSAGEALVMAGHKVALAKDGVEVIGLYSKSLKNGAAFDIVIMDLTIPGSMGGAEAIKRLIELDPAVKAIVASGYSNDPVMGNHESYGFKGILPKPFTIEQLRMEMSRVIALNNNRQKD